MERNVFGKTNLNVDSRGLDRFVLPRHQFSDIRMRLNYHNTLEKVDIWNLKHQQQKKYKNYLTAELGLNDQLKFPKYKVNEQPWPCVPRKQSYLSSAYSCLDLPHFGYVFNPEILDWGTGDILVAALGPRYYMFSWEDQTVTGYGVARHMIHCCKFNPQGNMLLVGTNSNRLELHDIIKDKRIRDTVCMCFLTNNICAITSIDWSLTGYSFVALVYPIITQATNRTASLPWSKGGCLPFFVKGGCSRGAVSAYNQFGRHISRWYGKGQSIIMAVRVSPDARYVAVAHMNSPILDILLWPSLKSYTSIDVNWHVKSIVWHPWRSALLGIGVAVPDFRTMIVLWDTPSDKMRHTNNGNYLDYNLDCMLFSHRTGEMVLSLWDPDRAMQHQKSSTQLVVMSDLYTVVDQSGEGRGDIDRVLIMVFSPDGTKLGPMVTADHGPSAVTMGPVKGPKRRFV